MSMIEKFHKKEGERRVGYLLRLNKWVTIVINNLVIPFACHISYRHLLLNDQHINN